MDAKPDLRDLMTTTDIGRMLSITRSGASLLSKRERDFPKPIGKLGHYTVWWRPEIETWVVERYHLVSPNYARRVRSRHIARPRAARV